MDPGKTLRLSPHVFGLLTGVPQVCTLLFTSPAAVQPKVPVEVGSWQSCLWSSTGLLQISELEGSKGRWSWSSSEKIDRNRGLEINSGRKTVSIGLWFMQYC